MKLAKYWEKHNGDIKCTLCPRYCIIKNNQQGHCRVRKNIDQKLYSLVYGKCVSTAIDPIEKKPLFHFHPGSDALSIGTVGCNLRCKHCQNWKISQSKFIEGEVITPSSIVALAKKHKCRSIAYTYNDPIVFFEFVLDTAKLAKKAGIKNVIVCNGFINSEPLKEWLKYIDAANIDYKGNDKFYRQVTGAWLEPVQESIKIINKSKCHLEVTNLLIPTLNDKPKQIMEMCEFVASVNNNIPLHISRFFPYYKLEHIQPTPEKSLLRAKKIAKKTHLKYVYIGNIETDENTNCPECDKLLIRRNRFDVIENNLDKTTCKFCKEKLNFVN